VKLSAIGVLTRAGKALTDMRTGRIGNRFRDVLFDSLFKALRRATNVPTVTVAHKLVDYVVLMMGRSFFVAGKSCLVVKTTRGSTEKKQRFTADVICFSNFVEMFPIHGMCK